MSTHNEETEPHQDNTTSTPQGATPKKPRWWVLVVIALVLIIGIPAVINLSSSSNTTEKSASGLSSARASVACGQYAKKYLKQVYGGTVEVHTVGDSGATFDSGTSTWRARVGFTAGGIDRNAYCTVSGTEDNPMVSSFKYA